MFSESFFQKNIMLWTLVVIIVSSLFLFFSEISLNRKARIIFLDVGQGDSILIITPNGRQVLIDSGKYSDISMKIAKYIPLSRRTLDLVIATHPDIDHIAGFYTLLDEYEINYFIHSGLLAGEPIYRSIAKKVRKYDIPAISVIAGEKIYIDRDMYLEILSPHIDQKIDNPNDYSVVVRLVYKNHAILLTGDASQFVEKDLVAMYGSNLKSDILKLGHHGSKTSNNSNFIKTVDPEYGIISAGCNNSFGHPHASVLRILDENHIKELSTCEEGDIFFEFKNNSWVLKEN